MLALVTGAESFSWVVVESSGIAATGGYSRLKPTLPLAFDDANHNSGGNCDSCNRN